MERGGEMLAGVPCTGDGIHLTGTAPARRPQGVRDCAMVSRAIKETPELRHRRYGHLSYDNLASATRRTW
jgi:hypothetical protein